MLSQRYSDSGRQMWPAWVAGAGREARRMGVCLRSPQSPSWLAGLITRLEKIDLYIRRYHFWQDPLSLLLLVLFVSLQPSPLPLSVAVSLPHCLLVCLSFSLSFTPLLPLFVLLSLQIFPNICVSSSPFLHFLHICKKIRHHFHGSITIMAYGYQTLSAGHVIRSIHSDNMNTLYTHRMQADISKHIAVLISISIKTLKFTYHYLLLLFN